MFDRHPHLPVDLVFNLQTPAGSITYPRYVYNWQSTMRQACASAASKSKARGERAKVYYDHKVGSSVLQSGDRVLNKNLSERGGPQKLQSIWEEKIYLVVKQKAPDSLAYELETNLEKDIQGHYTGTCYSVVVTCFFLSQKLTPNPSTQGKVKGNKEVPCKDSLAQIIHSRKIT